VLARIGFHLCPIKAHITQLHQFHLTTNMQYLNKKRLKFREKSAAKCSYAVMVRVVICAEVSISIQN